MEEKQEQKNLEIVDTEDKKEISQAEENVASENEKTSSKGKKRYFRILPYVLVLVPCIALGVFAGVEIKKYFGGYEDVDYDGIDNDSLYPNYDKVYKKYTEAKSKGSDFTKLLTPTEMAESAFCLIQKEEKVFSQGIGEATASIVDQQIRSTTVQNGNQFFEESISHSSMIDLADRMYQVPTSDGKDCKVTMYVGKTDNGNVNKGVFEGNGTEYSGAEYIAHMGRLLSTPTSYIVSDKTVLVGEKSGNMYDITKASKTSDGYTVDIELNATYGVSAYVIQMQTISDLATKPSFFYCHLTFDLDSDLNLKSITSYESYMAKTKMGASSKVTGKMRVVYERGGDYSIPSLNEPCTYRSEM